MRPIDHDKRRQRILEEALKLFAKDGYQATTLTKIAEASRCPRTMLYRYFSSKREIFKYTVHLVTQELAAKYANIEKAPGTSYEKLQRVMEDVLDCVFAQSTLLTVILDFVLSTRRTGHSPSRIIARHTYGLRVLLHRLIMAGIRRREIRPLPVSTAVNLLYSQMEAAILRITISDNADREEILSTIQKILLWMRAEEKNK